MWGEFLLLAIGAYLLGSVPSGFLISRIKGLDITKVGSGNIGATNIYRSLGITPAISVAIIDIFKGIIPTLAASYLLPKYPWIIIAIALFTILGHVFSLFLNFKGGKGVATYAGTLFVLLGIWTMIPLIIIWVFLLHESKLMSLTNLSLIIIMPFLVIMITHSLPLFLYLICSGALIFYTHRENIKRLRLGEEKKLELPWFAK